MRSRRINNAATATARIAPAAPVPYTARIVPQFVVVGSEVAHRVTQCWPPSAAQTVHADFPHTAFTKIQSSGMPKKVLGRSG
jgi:hypothetical protein